ncbi:unnamed protein product [Ceutorhynchus assimilis]|uniref:Uncharacterized protein n=1 Tax=Ceutorhynchus assimilis TaxID=467358 RepID=A0A9N9MGA5_9CUCU|nr:unnamed protein product [Ceutorhynchus assimilis]
MREIWTKQDERRISDGQPVAKKWNITDPVYKPKGLSHSPSLRAIRNYNDLPIDRSSGEGVDNPGFESDYKYEYYTYPGPGYSVPNDNSSKLSENEYPTISTRSMKTTYSGGSEVHSNADNEMGSNVKLVTAKVEMSCKTWCTHVSTIICTISMAAALGNLYRLPQTVLLRGGLPFLVVYAILTVIIGLPLLFLELGIGQMAQEGFIKSWRAVPFFKGIGYVKLLAGCLLSIYYPIYMGLAIMYLIWTLKGSVPFVECSNGVVITADGYVPAAINGQECIRNTFIKSPFQDPYYFGIYAALLLFIWIVIIVLSIRRTKSYIRSLILLLFPTMVCYIALTTKSILLEAEMAVLYKMAENVDWSILKTAEVWYYATIQVFFSTNIGFGSFITNAGIMYNKVNPLWTALGYIAINLIFGTGSVIMTTILTGATSNDTNSTISSTVAEVQLFTLIYDAMVNQSSDFKNWMIATYLLVIFSGFVSMATLSYTLLKAIYGHDGIRLKWWQTSVVFSFSGFILSCLLLLKNDFDLVHLLDHYIVGNLIFICVIIEVFAMMAFYGLTRIQSDFEFMLGHILLKVWLFLWWLTPICLTIIFIWALIGLPLEGIYKIDPVWMVALGWSVVIMAFMFIIVIGIFVTRKQNGYTIKDKLKASLEPSHNWGPKDPMLRYNWVQWNSKSQTGERDFTLKRRGTKEYTKTIRKRVKKEASQLYNGLPGAYFKNTDTTINNNIIGNGALVNENANRISQQSNEYSRISNTSNNYNSIYYISSDVKANRNGHVASDQSMIDSLEPEIVPKRHHHHHHHKVPKVHRNTYPTDNNYNYTEPEPRHSYPSNKEIVNDENSEGYGTFRNKGPYIIDGDIGHVCHKRYDSEHEAVTEL